MGTPNRRERRQADLRRHDDHAVPPSRRKQRPERSPPTTDLSTNRLKKKIRGLARVMEHDVGPQDQVEMERAIAGYKTDLETASRQKTKHERIGKYHMVRFFERQKATRHLKKAKKRLEASEQNTQQHNQALQDIHIAEVDLNYTQYFPLDAKYEGIYARKQNDEGNLVMKEDGNGGEAQTALASRPAMWTIVENCTREGTLDALRDGKMTQNLSVNRTKQLPKNHAKGPGGGVMLDGSTATPSKKETPSQHMDVDDDSDGGFFER